MLSFLFDSKNEVNDVIKNLSESLESINISEENNKKYYRIIYQILIEFIENISKHSQLSSKNKAWFHIIQEKNELFLKTIWYCKYEDFDKLNKTNELNDLSRDEVKEMFLKKMCDWSGLSDRWWAGLGYFRIARLIKRHFPEIKEIFELQKIQEKDDLINFYISIKIPKPENTKKLS